MADGALEHRCQGAAARITLLVGGGIRKLGRVTRSKALIALAGQIVESLPPELGAEAFVTGSVSRGLADEWSDVELMLATDAVPPLERCLRWWGGEVLTSGRDGAAIWIDGVRGGTKVEMWWQAYGWIDEEIDEILAGHVRDPGRLTLADAYLRAVAIRSEGRLAVWQGRLHDYPEALREGLIREAAAIWDVRRASLGMAYRNDRLPLETAIVEQLKRTLRILFAVNRLWEPQWKWIRQLVDSLDSKPPRLVERIDEALLAADSLGALRASLELTRDSLALVPAGIDVAGPRAGVERLLADLTPFVDRSGTGVG